MANNRTSDQGIADQEKTLGLAGSHSAQTKYQHHQTDLDMKPTEDLEEREAKQQLATVNEGGDEGGRLQLATVEETVTERDGETSLRTYTP